jgi:DNA-binding MarR family transcriptional regulator
MYAVHIQRRRAVLRQLDDLLARIRVTQQRPWFRARLLGPDTIGSPAELRVLRAIENSSAAGGAPSIRDVAEELALEQSSASRAVETVARRGLVAKAAADSDSRRTILSLTETGRRALAVTTERRLNVLVDATEGWAADDVTALADLLCRLVDALDGLERDSGS